jgi:hypothetical protein
MFDSNKPVAGRQGARSKIAKLCDSSAELIGNSPVDGRIGILAYGSLLSYPGAELAGLIERRIDGVLTPFAVEFARAASRRGGAPTLAPVDRGGAQVEGSLLLLEKGTDLEPARHALYRREINRIGSELTYDHHAPPSPNRVRVDHLCDHRGCAKVLYAKLPVTLEPDPVDLARRAIASAKGLAGDEGRDGISYLMGIKAHGVTTPLSPAYEREILRQTSTTSLAEALVVALDGAPTPSE